MKKFEDIKIDTTNLNSLLYNIELNKLKNLGCLVINYWKERWGKKILEEVQETKKLPYGFVGDGWPKKNDQSWSLNHDEYDMKGAFLEHDSRDVGDALYQANIIYKYLKDINSHHIYIVDFGSGYGRLAIPLIYKLRGKVTYIGIDYTPCGLLIAPQF